VIWRVRANVITLAVAGTVYAAAIFVVMWWAILPSVDPAMKLVNGLGFFIAHLVFGVLLGLGIATRRGSLGGGAGREGAPSQARGVVRGLRVFRSGGSCRPG
jgi:hypothetical protein